MGTRVAELMTTPVLTTTPGTRATDAALVIALHDITALPVLTGGRVVGMFTEHDLLRVSEASGQSGLTVGALMSPISLTADPGQDTTALATEMQRHQVHSVPVLEAERLVGIITHRDLAPGAPAGRPRSGKRRAP